MSPFIVAIALAIPLSSAAEDVTPTEAGSAVSGGPAATPLKQAPVFTSWTAESQKSADNAQPGNSAVTLPMVKAGESVAGGDVGDAVVEQQLEIAPAWEGLEALSPDDKANAVIQLETGNDVSASEAEAIEQAETLWDNGVFSQAIDTIRSMEESGTDLAVGISWKTPKAVVSPDWMDSDVRIGARTSIRETALDFDAQNGNQFAVLRYDGNWSVNISTDGGQTWAETYTWGADVDDISAAVADDYLWVGYVFTSANDQGRMRRFNVSDGSVDSVYGYQTVFDKDVPIKEIALWTNADSFDNRVYYNAILESPAPVASAGELSSAYASGAQEPPVEQSAPVEDGASFVEVKGPEALAPVEAGSFDGDIRDLPTVPDPQADAPRIIIPEGQLPDGTGDGWEINGLDVDAGAEIADGALTDEVLDLGGAYDTEAFTPHVDFSGIGYQSLAPPDTVGDVGPNHYIQMVNASVFQIWDKNGNTLAGPTALDSLWTAGGACAIGRGDPIVVYDELADRWVMSEFALSGYHLCVYVSQTSDPVSGGWYLYDFPTPNFPDYPKYGVWPDGYYVSTYEGSTLGAYVLERNAMLSGAAASSQRFTTSSLTPSSSGACANTRDTRMLPSHVDGPAPPAGSPNYFFRSVEACQDVSNATDRLEIFEFDVDWTTPANSTFTLAHIITPAGFTLVTCSPGVRDCIPQPGTAVKLDALTNRPMMHLQYRNFGSHQTLVTNQAVDAGSNVSGVRWYELRKTTGSWSIHQQGTYSPDSNGRWMGSIAMDGAGNIALGYSVSSSSVLPSIRYTGRLAGDTLGTMPEPETTLIAGSGVQTWTQRWGDYSAMGVDPADDCTFWYTNEYILANGDWATHVGSFTFDECGGTNLVFFWADTAGVTWYEQDTGVSNADWGLDATWNEGATAYYGFVSYIADAGGTAPVKVLRWNGATWDDIQLLSDYTGFIGTSRNGTSVSAYGDNAFVAYEHSYTNGMGIRYNVSYNGGDSWTQGWWDPEVGHAYFNPDLTARGGQGTAIVYDDEAGAFDPVIFRYRDHYSGGAWDAEVAQINEFDGATAWSNRIEYLPPSAGSYAYGAIYISWDPDAGTPYFDRSDIAAGNYGFLPSIYMILFGD